FTFVKVNVDVKGAEKIAMRYNITRLPLFMLFHKGHAVMDKNGMYASLTGFVTEEQLNQFIHNYCDERIRQAIALREEKREQRIKDSKNVANPYFYASTMYTPSGDISSWKKPLRNSFAEDEK